MEISEPYFEIIKEQTNRFIALKEININNPDQVN